MYNQCGRTVERVGPQTAGNAYAHYKIVDGDKLLCDIPFQNGTIPEVGVIGATNECLLAIVIDRLESFQSSKFACAENEIALLNCKAALRTLNYRTELRAARGVEGTHQK